MSVNGLELFSRGAAVVPLDLSTCQLWKTKDVATLLGMSREQVWRLWSAGRLPGYKFDRHLRFDDADLRAFLEAHYTQVRSAAVPRAARRHRTIPGASDYQPL